MTSIFLRVFHYKMESRSNSGTNLNLLSGESIWEVGGECNAISVSPSKDLVVVAGRDGKKILNFDREIYFF